MKKNLKICVLFLLITNLCYSQKCTEVYSNIKYRMAKSVKYNNKLQKGLLFKKFPNKKVKLFARKPKRYSFRIR